MKSLFRMMIAVAAASVGLAVFAADAVFTALPMCGKINGVAQIRMPGSEKWEQLRENKFYPLGSSYRTVGADSSLEVYFGEKSVVTASGDSLFNIEKREIGEKTRSLTLQSGTIDLNLPRNLPEGLFTLTARGFTVKNPAGESRYVCTKTGDGDMTLARCVTGTMALSGMHFNIPAMRAADELKIRTSHDLLYTGLNCFSVKEVLTALDHPRTGHGRGDQEFRHRRGGQRRQNSRVEDVPQVRGAHTPFGPLGR